MKALLVNAELGCGASAAGVGAGAKPTAFGGEATGEVVGDLVGGDMVGGLIIGGVTGTGGLATGEGVCAVGVTAGEGDGRRSEIGAGARAGAWAIHVVANRPRKINVLRAAIIFQFLTREIETKEIALFVFVGGRRNER